MALKLVAHSPYGSSVRRAQLGSKWGRCGDVGQKRRFCKAYIVVYSGFEWCLVVSFMIIVYFKYVIVIVCVSGF